MHESPIQLTEEQKKVRYEQKRKDFMDAYEQMCRVHEMCFMPILDVRPQGIVATNVVVNYNPKQEHGGKNRE